MNALQPTAKSLAALGLGLAIVKEYMQLHGGSISLVSAFGHGATFMVRLSLRAPAGLAVAADLQTTARKPARE